MSFWRIPNFAASSPVEAILDKETFTLEELLDEEDIIQECKALNIRLINFLRDRAQVAQLVRYIIEDAPEDAESRRIFKFPFIACEIFTCEIDVILKSLVEDKQLMDMLFSFLEPNRSHTSLLSGYFSKVVICLMLRKTTSLMNYVQNHGGIFHQLIDLIGITSIMEVLVRLVNAEDHIYPNYMDVMQWLSDCELLEIIVDKLNPSMSPEVHANTAEVLLAIVRNAPSALAAKLASPSFIERMFNHALEDPFSKSALVHVLSVCISFLNPKIAAPTGLGHSVGSQHPYEPSSVVHDEIISAMLPKLSDLFTFLNVSCDEKILPTTFGQLKPPFGKHRLRIVEFISVMLQTGNEAVENELVSLGVIQRLLDLFFTYPFNNALHHHVESILVACFESRNITIVNHLFHDCKIIRRFLHADKNPILLGDGSLVTSPDVGKQLPRAGYMGHITRIANKLVQFSNNDSIHTYLKEDDEWSNWQTNVLSERNAVENVYKWACGRPTTFQDRTRDSDEEDEMQDRDYDMMTFSNSLSQPFRYRVYENDDTSEAQGLRDQEDQDVYFDDESAEVVISSLRLGDDHERCVFTNSNWFTFQEDIVSEEPSSTSSLDRLDEINLNEAQAGQNDSSEEVVIREESLVDNSQHLLFSMETKVMNHTSIDEFTNVQATDLDEAASNGFGPFQFEARGGESGDDLFNDQQLPDWVGWREPSDILVDGSIQDHSLPTDTVAPAVNESPMSTLDSSEPSGSGEAASSLFEDDAEFVGVETEGTGKTIDQATGSSICGSLPKLPELRKTCEDSGIMEFKDMSHWRVEPEVGIVQE